jgi:fatty acyl-CoA reductase
VFNIVASVRFNETLHDAIDINFLGTKKVVNLVLGIEKLKSFVHVSTLYSNCNRDEIDEKIYDHVLNYHQLIQVAKIMKDVKDKRVLEEWLLQGLPNTYTLTKHFAEKLVYHQTFFIPSGIFRPAVGNGREKFKFSNPAIVNKTVGN